jgi:hypothetical protein
MRSRTYPFCVSLPEHTRTRTASAVKHSVRRRVPTDGKSRINEGEGSIHNMKPELSVQMLNLAKTYGGGQFTPLAQAQQFHACCEDSFSTNPNFDFVPLSELIVLGVAYIHAGFFTNGTIGAGGVANFASIASFNGAHFAEDGQVIYVPERSRPFLSLRSYESFLTFISSQSRLRVGSGVPCR